MDHFYAYWNSYDCVAMAKALKLLRAKGKRLQHLTTIQRNKDVTGFLATAVYDSRQNSSRNEVYQHVRFPFLLYVAVNASKENFKFTRINQKLLNAAVGVNSSAISR